MKKVLVGAMALLTLAACSNEEVLDQNQVRNEIGFTAVTGKALSRAANGYCNKDMPEDFLVWANVPDGSTGYKKYFSGDQFDRDGTSTIYKNNGDVRYWPYSAINFFAVKNAGANVGWNGTNSTIVVTVFAANTTAKDQVDFIYAVANVATKPTSGQTDINFRHALSQIEFQAKNMNSKLYVEISGVSVCKVNNKGTFTLPETKTSGNVAGSGSGDVHDTYPGGPIGTQGGWVLASTSTKTQFDITTKQIDASGNEVDTDEARKVPGDGNVVSLSVINKEKKEYGYQTLYLLPQTLTGWVPSSSAPKPADQDGAYFLVKCKIYNVAGATFDPSTDVRIWPSTNTYADVAIPFSATWEQGKRYVYTFVFTTDGTGGYDPNPGGTDPVDVLVPIKLDVTVDDFVKTDDTPVPMAH